MRLDSRLAYRERSIPGKTGVAEIRDELHWQGGTDTHRSDRMHRAVNGDD